MGMQSSSTLKAKPVTILPLGIDLAKNVFAVHGVNEAGKPGKPELVRPSVARAPNYMRWWRRCRRA